MREVGIISLDLASSVFLAHGAEADGSVAFRRKLLRAQPVEFMGEQPPCIVAMKACASAHHWGRAIGDLGHDVRLIPPACVKPFVKRQKNDMADAEAITGAESRPTMPFVAVKSEAQQATAMAYRTFEDHVRVHRVAPRNLRDGNARRRRLKADRPLFLVRPKPLRPTRHHEAR
jgi:transposase